MIQGYGDYDGVGLAQLIAKREVSPLELMETAIVHTTAMDKELNFLAVECFDLGRKAAAQALPTGPLAGVPYLLKDTFTSWAGTITTNGCNLYRNFVSPSDTETVRKAKVAGLLMFAKSTTPEFGWALATETLLHGDTLNPWDKTKTPGGSTGGGAAAVAAGGVPFANASDGGGSIRIPAAYCGLVGHKPSRGRITWGPDVAEVCSGVATEGVVSRTVRDQAAYLDIMHGQLPGDRDLPPPVDETFQRSLNSPLRKLRIGFTTESFSHVATYEAGISGVQRAAKLCTEMGHLVEEASLGGFDYIKAYSHIRGIFGMGHYATLCRAAVLKGCEPSGDDFTRFMFESARDSARMTGFEYAQHVEGIRQGARQMELACLPFDIVLTPMSIIAPPAIGHNHMHHTELNQYHDTLRDYGMVFSVPFNVGGQPACSIPIGIDQNGLPVGLQIVGKWGDDVTVLQLAAEFERAAPWSHLRPPTWIKEPDYSPR
ncbi:amidase [Phyllobacterium sophorae]|uniref:Amidase domain-containing protein n=1 Tax=Phyllobacterium sophorae TaxID=1520277 RepID=A0A2P7B6S9_9HYPH|nr:amidase [Phyllobacterium sophorae]PSH62174.1 hypothetical protein CU103_20275 [Phyllobacterium sophorae]